MRFSCREKPLAGCNFSRDCPEFDDVIFHPYQNTVNLADNPACAGLSDVVMVTTVVVHGATGIETQRHKHLHPPINGMASGCLPIQ